MNEEQQGAWNKFVASVEAAIKIPNTAPVEEALHALGVVDDAARACRRAGIPEENIQAYKRDNLFRRRG